MKRHLSSRREFLAAVGVGMSGILTGCSSSSPDGDEVEGEPIYDINPKNFEIGGVSVVRNLPDKVGVSFVVTSKQLSGTTVAFSVEIVTRDGTVVFENPSFPVGLDGGEENSVTCWFSVEDTSMVYRRDLYPRVRLLTSQPK